MIYYMKCQSLKDLMGSKIYRTNVLSQLETKRTRDSFLTAVFLSKMPGKKKKNVYRKKRKGKPFAGVQRHAKKAKKTPPDGSGVPKTTPREQPSSDSELDQSPSASRLKMKPEVTSDSDSECFDDETACQGEGYRLIDLKKLSSAMSEAHASIDCNQGEK